MNEPRRKGGPGQAGAGLGVGRPADWRRVLSRNLPAVPGCLAVPQLPRLHRLPKDDEAEGQFPGRWDRGLEHLHALCRKQHIDLTSCALSWLPEPNVSKVPRLPFGWASVWATNMLGGRKPHLRKGTASASQLSPRRYSVVSPQSGHGQLVSGNVPGRRQEMNDLIYLAGR